ncbi:MAG: hypothetical protein NTW87_03045 [Planctomycetota bacterium]|nr:hypothetical protein [Planctomycetota bacterium]
MPVIAALLASLFPESNLNAFSYRRGAETLSKFEITNDSVGRRTALRILPTGEEFSYGYDVASRLARERRTIPVPGLPSKFTDTTYQYDAVGNRTRREVAGAGADDYAYNARQELTAIAHLDGSGSTFGYDANGNSTSKSHTGTTLQIAYTNAADAPRQCTLVVDEQARGTLTFAIHTNTR